MPLVNSRYLKAEATRSANWRWTGTGVKSYEQDHGARVGLMAAESGLPGHAGAGRRLHLSGVDCRLGRA